MMCKQPHNIVFILRFIIIITLSYMLMACTTSTAQAPVYSLWYQPIANSGQYTVKRHDTLYSIAWNFGLDYQQLATINHLSPPYTIQPGQVLALKSSPTYKQATKKRQPATKKSPRNNNRHSIHANHTIKHWIWPARGRISSSFSNKPTGNKGINIKGRVGEPIIAAAPGTVVYSGDGVRGYGNLIIIKHNKYYLSAYAYNQKLLVKKGTKVHAGQRIALMGKNNAGDPLLHFEIRRQGKPTNPMRFLTKQAM